jgi:hypothetical protein
MAPDTSSLKAGTWNLKTEPPLVFVPAHIGLKYDSHDSSFHTKILTKQAAVPLAF